MAEPSRASQEPLIIAGVGARTVAGLTALQVTMSALAQKFPLRESHMVDRNGEPIAVARLMSIGDQVVGIDRFIALGAPPLTQAAFPWLDAQRRLGVAPAPIPVVLALPSKERPGFDPRLEQHLLPALAARSRVPLDVARSSLVLLGRGGGVAAFEKARELFAQGVPAVLVGGIDSYFDSDVLDFLDNERRLHGPDTENGFIPGEGAAFVLLVAQQATRSLVIHGRIIAAATTEEPRPYGSDEPCLGVGMTLAVKRAAGEISGTGSIRWVLTDVTDERHRVDEWTYAFARNHAAFSADVVHDQPLLKTGDLGAASVAVLLAMIAIRWQTGCAVDPTALIAVHSDGPTRGALLVIEERTAR